VLEFGSGGHSLVYLKKITTVALAVADEITIASSINEDLLGAFGDATQDLESVRFLDSGNLWNRKRRISSRVEETFCGILTGLALRRQLGYRVSKDWKVFFSNFPVSRFLFLKGLLSVLRTDWAAFLVNAPFLRNSSSDRRTERLLRQKRCRKIFSLDEGRVDWIRSRFPQAQSDWLPDFSIVSTKDGILPKTLRAHARGRPIILLIGRISEKKGLSEFFDLASDDSLKRFFFAIVGKCEMPGLAPQTRDRLVNDFEPRENTFFFGEEIASRMLPWFG
jgi:hypothetical protein